MDREVLRKVLSAVIENVDYDIWKERFNEDTAEYGLDVDAEFDEIIDIAEGVLEEEGE